MKKIFYKLILIYIAVILCFSAVGCKAHDAKTTEVGREIRTLFSKCGEKVNEDGIFVSVNGKDDGNSGSIDYPVKTVKKALFIAKNTGVKNITVTSGDYRETLNVTESGINLRTLGNVNLIGSVTIPVSKGASLLDTERKRLKEEVRDKVIKYNLRNYGFTYGNRLYADSGTNTARYYGNSEVGLNILLTEGEEKLVLARYPNEGFLRCGEIAEEQKTTGQDKNGGAFYMDEETADHVRRWYSEDVWIRGYPYYDWSDACSPAKITDDLVYPKYYSHYGQKEGAEYYFYNVFDELDTKGEYYIDYDTCMLYVYPNGEEDIELAYSHTPLITVSADNVTVSGFNLYNVAETAIKVNGNGNVLSKLTVKNVTLNAVELLGTDNVVTGCNISHLGKGGVISDGGDRKTLTPNNNLITQNVIHDFGETALTYQPAIYLYGMGSTASHNEIYNSPHTAIFYSGNDHIIEYNYIHETVLHSIDAGAIYAGRSWSWYGNVIRYNLIENTGTEEFQGNGIYFDDTLSGQEAYGNILLNTRGFAFLIGGGHDNKVYNNVIYNEYNTERSRGIYFDSRGRDQSYVDGKYVVKSLDLSIASSLRLWETLDKTNSVGVDYKSDIWKAKYPELYKTINDPTYAEINIDDEYFPINPARNYLYNVEINTNPAYYGKYVKVESNKNSITELNFSTLLEAKFNIDSLKFTELPEGFTQIPSEKIGVTVK